MKELRDQLQHSTAQNELLTAKCKDLEETVEDLKVRIIISIDYMKKSIGLIEGILVLIKYELSINQLPSVSLIIPLTQLRLLPLYLAQIILYNREP